ncbi:MAG: NAD(P)-binding domain-containing protein, partial [Rhodobacteraceae bacterium]|nr:NAD(P)-binding domain-containing protein [Paracoccaceae bacterium]
MRKATVIGLGDMGSGLAKNLIKAGFDVAGFDLSTERLALLEKIGGMAASNVAEAGRDVQVAFVMVMNGDQAKAVILGPDGLVQHMGKGGVVILTATIKPREAAEIGAAM